VSARDEPSEMLARFAREATFGLFLLCGPVHAARPEAELWSCSLCSSAASPSFAGGVLTAVPCRSRPRHPRQLRAGASTPDRARSTTQSHCERHGVDSSGALQFPLRHPASAAVLTGPRSVGRTRGERPLFQARSPTCCGTSSSDDRRRPSHHFWTRRVWEYPWMGDELRRSAAIWAR